MAKKKCPACPALAKWMTTFSDMNQLLMTFFVLLVSMANFDPVKMQEAFGLLTGSRSILNFEAPTPAQPFSMTPPMGRKPEDVAVEEAKQALDTYVEAQKLQQQMSIIQTEQGFNVRILDSVLFRVGSYEILPAAYPILDQVASMGAVSHFYLIVKGHADDQASGQIPDFNWTLSANRALEVLKYIERRGVDGARLSATAFGQHHPTLPNISAENRAMNRRVEISFITPEFYESNKEVFGNSGNLE
ncbi:MAG: flagellar motor protein MotB [Deferribacteraceae bacterium]|jgi:chemotaxis protein MotB|nr:flagellar motor protein MotB [Deferribacteraceae bacterium]